MEAGGGRNCQGSKKSVRRGLGMRQLDTECLVEEDDQEMGA